MTILYTQLSISFFLNFIQITGIPEIETVWSVWESQKIAQNLHLTCKSQCINNNIW